MTSKGLLELRKIEGESKRASGTLETKRAIQNMMFPEGILFDFKNDTYRTTRVNSIFALINSVSTVLGENKNRTEPNNFDLSCLVAGARLELTTSGL